MKNKKTSKKSNKNASKILYSRYHIIGIKSSLNGLTGIRKQLTAYKKDAKKDLPIMYRQLRFLIKRVGFATKHKRKVLKLMQNNIKVSEQDLFIDDMVDSWMRALNETVDFFGISSKKISDVDYKNVFGVTPQHQAQLNKFFDEHEHHTFGINDGRSKVEMSDFPEIAIVLDNSTQEDKNED